MNNKAIQGLVPVVLAMIAFFVPLDIASNIALAAGILAGAIVTIVLSGSNASSASDSAEDDSDYKGETKTLYVGNLPYRANEAAVRELFSKEGAVVSVRLMRDRNTGKRKGFGFVEMAASDANSAIDALNDVEFQQRTLKVREAKERAPQADKEVIAD